MKTKTISVIASALLLPSFAAEAGTMMPSTKSQDTITTDSGWNVRIASYGWFTAMDGDIAVAGNFAPVDVKFSDIIDKIDFAFMGVIEVGRGDWSFASDLFYAKLSTDNNIGATLFDVEMQQFIGNFVIIRNMIDDGTTRFDVYGGARVTYLDTEILIDRPIPFMDINASESKTWVDPIIGVRYNRNLSEKLYFRGVADIGGFGIQSDFTWQAYAALGYRLNEKSAISVGYRAIGTDYTDGGFTYDIVSHGLLLGYEYKF